jgi:hypothetical protein
VAGIKSERWPASNRNRWPDCVGIRSRTFIGNMDHAPILILRGNLVAL